MQIIPNSEFEFDTIKPVRLLNRIFKIATNKNSIVLDSFAGSGTTAHAVIALNKKDGGNRKFILVETEDYADKLTAERTRRVINGYKFEGTQREELLREPITLTALKKAAQLLERADSFDLLDKQRFDRITKSVEDGALVVTGEKKITEKVAGLGGSFTFCTLGEEMSMDRLLAGDKLPSFDALAKYVFYTATGRTLADVPKQKTDGDGFIGEMEFYRVHLYYKPEKKWLASNDAALTEQLVQKMLASNKENKRLLVFAAAKFMAQKELTRQGVEFCQLPYAIHRILGD
jgi:adenine-specific DNA-methyltransferase